VRQSSQLSLLAECRAVLSDEERVRAERFLRLPDQHLAALSRGFRRLVLGSYLHSDPRSLRFHTGQFGKPALLEDSSGVEFNVSHSGGVLLFAIALRRPIGIDVEQIASTRDTSGVSGVFSEQEQARLQVLAPALHLDGLYHCWTQKEALLKLWGGGLHLPLDDFDVEVDPTREPRLLATRTSRAACSLLAVPVPAGYRANVAVQGASPTLRVF